MYTYAIGALFFVGIWSALFGCVRKSRKVLLWASIAFGHAGPISEYWHSRDYWSPEKLLAVHIGPWRFGLEDYLFAFAFSGLCAGVFDLLARKWGQKELKGFTGYGFIGLVLIGGACLMSMGVLVGFLNLNSLHAIVLAFLAGATVIMTRRREWIGPAFLTAFIVAAVMWLFYWGFFFRLFPNVKAGWWYLHALSSVSVAGVPVEEVIWAWAVALFTGPILRYCMQRGNS
jgi:hypothetical protein